MFKQVIAIMVLAVGAGVFMADMQSDPEDLPTIETVETTSIDVPVKRERRATPPPRQVRSSADRRRNVREQRGGLHPDTRPPRDYEIIYLGSEACPACRMWEAEQYADWRRDPLRRKVRVRMAEVERFAVNRGVPGENFGRYQSIYERAFRDRRFAFPAFVLMDGREIIRAGTGAGTWERFVHMAREEERYAEELEEFFRTHPNVRRPW
ncbi:MAG: hypothetical protein AAF683_15945 [Pseudomonadota bacterium]